MISRRSFLSLLAAVPVIGRFFRPKHNPKGKVFVGTVDEIRQFIREAKYVYLFRFYVTSMSGRRAVIDSGDEMLRGCYINNCNFSGEYLPPWESESVGAHAAALKNECVGEVKFCSFSHFYAGMSFASGRDIVL